MPSARMSGDSKAAPWWCSGRATPWARTPSVNFARSVSRLMPVNPSSSPSPGPAAAPSGPPPGRSPGRAPLRRGDHQEVRGAGDAERADERRLEGRAVVVLGAGDAVGADSLGELRAVGVQVDAGQPFFFAFARAGRSAFWTPARSLPR